MDSQSFTYDVEKALTANSFTRTGYAFNGWNPAADAKGTAYTDKQKVKNTYGIDIPWWEDSLKECLKELL